MALTSTLAVVAARPAVIGANGLGRRWGISRRAAAKWAATEGFPEGQQLDDDAMTVYTIADVAAWEDARREAGLPIPGERPRGRAPEDPERRSRRFPDS